MRTGGEFVQVGGDDNIGRWTRTTICRAYVRYRRAVCKRNSASNGRWGYVLNLYPVLRSRQISLFARAGSNDCSCLINRSMQESKSDCSIVRVRRLEHQYNSSNRSRLNRSTAAVIP